MGEACDGHSALTPYPTPLLFYPAPISLCCPHNLKTRKYSWEMVTSSVVPINYRKIPKISPGAYIFQRPFLRGLYSEGLMYGGKFAFQNRFGKPSSWKEIYRFFGFILYLRAISKYKPPEGRFNGGFFALRDWGAYTWRGLFSEFYGTSQLITNFSKNEKEWMLP